MGEKNRGGDPLLGSRNAFRDIRARNVFDLAYKITAWHFDECQAVIEWDLI